MRTVVVNIETGVFHSTDECVVAQRTNEERKREVPGDGSHIVHGLRCRTCHTPNGDPR